MEIVWFSEIKWDYLRTRKHQIILRKPADLRVLFIEPYTRGRRNRYTLREENDVLCATVPFVKAAPVLLWRKFLGIRRARLSVERLARFRVAQLLNQAGFDRENTGFILSNIFAVDVALKLRKKFLLYDCNDAHAAFPGMPDYTEGYFSRACRFADLVFASSRALKEKVTKARGNDGRCEYLGNGVDFASFDSTEADIERRVSLGKIRLGFVGAIAPWVDFDAISALARSHPDWEVVLVGPVLHGVGEAVEGLSALPSVRLLDPVPYEQVPDILRGLTVGLIPFRFGELTSGMNPDKLYEYLASGLPVVATSFSAEVRSHPEVVRTAGDVPSFVKACEEVVEEVSHERGALCLARAAKRIARENDWDLVATEFWKRIKELMEKDGDCILRDSG